MVRYEPPIEIHVCWPTTVAPQPATLEVIDRIHRRLGRWVGPGVDAPALRDQDSGAGLPVLLGIRPDRLPKSSPTCPRVLVGVFDKESYFSPDLELDAAIRDSQEVLVVDRDEHERFRERFNRPTVGRDVDPVDALLPRLTTLLGGPTRVTVFVHDPLDRQIADAVRARILARRLDAFFVSPASPASNDAAALRASPNASVFVHVGRDSARGTYRDSYVLIAKELATPLVKAIWMTTGDAREPAYGGNAPALVVDPGDPATIDRLVDEISQAWLAHVYFRADAERARIAVGLPADTILLSRAPELADFATGMIPGSSAVVLYPDPPLPIEESVLLRRQHARIRMVTPTTAHGQILARSVRPPLDGMRIALSLSNSPDLPRFEAAGDAMAWHGPHHARGLTDRHYRDLVKHLTMGLIRGGAELAYGGHLDRGYSLTLSRLVSTHQRLQRPSAELLHLYLTEATKSGAGADAVRATAHVCATDIPGVTGETKAVLDRMTMRRKMAGDCHARVIIGGRTQPMARPADKNRPGYSGRFPGQAEEAWFTLTDDKPLYVIGSFGGAAELVGNALRGIHELESGESVPGFLEFCRLVDQSRSRPGPQSPGPQSPGPQSPGPQSPGPQSPGPQSPGPQSPGPQSMDEMLETFRSKGALLRNTADREAMWTNGLTVDENDTLFHSTQPTEIVALVMRGLLRVSRDSTKRGPLMLMPYHGSITDVPPVDAYVVPVVEGLPMGGADLALDRAMDGALFRGRQRLGAGTFTTAGHVEVLRVVGTRLAGQWVAMISLGNRDSYPGTQPSARALGEQIGRRAAELGWTEIATVPFGGNMTDKSDLAARTRALVEGIRSEGRSLQTIVFCEYDAEKYRLLANECLELAATDASLSVRTVPSSPVSLEQGSVASVLTVTREGTEVHSTLTPPRGSAVVHRHSTEISGWIHSLLSKATLDLTDAALATVAAEARRAVLSDDASNQLSAWRSNPIRVQHDEHTAALPFELLLASGVDGADEHVFAMTAGVSRALITSGAAPVTRTITGRPRVLLVVDPTEDLPRAREEAAQLETDLKLRGADVLPRLQGAAATPDAVENALHKIDILHYAGHATPEGLRLNGGVLGPTAFEGLGDKGPAIVVLNACQSASLTPSASRTHEQTLARSILHSGVRCFVGTGWRVPDDVGARFGRRFLREVVDAVPVGTAFARTLWALRHEDFSAHHWFYYRLYGDPDFVCR